MATTKQQKAAVAIIRNLQSDKPRPQGEVLRQVGYSQKTSTKPKLVTASKGFLDIMKSCGLTEEFIAQALVNDINGKPGARAKELALAAKILGMENKGKGEGGKTVNVLALVEFIGDDDGAANRQNTDT